MRNTMGTSLFAAIGVVALLAAGPAAAAPATVIDRDGTYRVGVDILPGIYHTNGLPGEYCYWERLSGFSGDLDDIIANDFSKAGPKTVDIKPGDAAFSTEGCGAWVMQPPPAPATGSAGR